MDVGIFDHLDRNATPLPDHYEARLRLIEAYDRLGFACYHLAEHHATPIGTAPSPSVFLAAVAQRTTRLHFAPLVYLLPFYHPVRLIEEICMLDQMSRGRLEIGIGRGVSPIEATYYGIEPAELADRYAEALEVILTGLASETLTYHGRYYDLDDVPMELAPYQRPHPPLWYGVHLPESAARCARAGYNIVVSDSTAASAEAIRSYRTAWAASGRSGEMPRLGLARFIVVAESDAAAIALGRRAYRQWLESFYHVTRRHGRTVVYGKPPDFDAAIAEGRGIAGSPETVRAIVSAQLAATNATYPIGQFAFGDLSGEEALRSVELFGAYVLPALQALVPAAV